MLTFCWGDDEIQRQSQRNLADGNWEIRLVQQLLLPPKSIVSRGDQF